MKTAVSAHTSDQELVLPLQQCLVVPEGLSELLDPSKLRELLAGERSASGRIFASIYKDNPREAFTDIIEDGRKLLNEANEIFGFDKLWRGDSAVRFVSYGASISIRSPFQLIEAICATLADLNEKLYQKGLDHSPATVAFTLMGGSLKYEGYHPPLAWSRELPKAGDAVQLAGLGRELLTLRPFTLREFSLTEFVCLEDGSLFGVKYPRKAQTFTGFDLLKELAKAQGSTDDIEHLRSPAIREVYQSLQGSQLGDATHHRNYLTLPSRISCKDTSKIRELLLKDGVHLQSSEIRWSCADEVVSEVKALIKDAGCLSTVSIMDCMGREIAGSAEMFDFLASKHPQESDTIPPQQLPETGLSRYIGPPASRPVPPALRTAREGEIVLQLEEVDALLHEHVLSADEIARKNGIESTEYGQITVDRNIWEIAQEVLRQIYPPGTPLFTSSFSDVKIGTQEGQVVFENIGHLLSYAYELNKFQMDELLRLAEFLGDIDKVKKHFGMFVPTPAELLLDIAHSPGFISPEQYDTAKAKYERWHKKDPRAIALHVKARTVADRRELSATELASVLTEVFIQRIGRIPANQEELLALNLDETRVKQENDKLQPVEYGIRASAHYAAYTQKIGTPGIGIPRRCGAKERDEILLESLRAAPHPTSLHPSIPSEFAPMYLSIVERYPSLSKLFFPRRETAFDAEKVVTSSLAAICHEILALPASSILGVERRTRSIENRVGYVKRFSETQRPFLNAASSILSDGFKQLGELKTQGFCTAPGRYQERIVVDSWGGWIIAESFGHMLSVYRDLHNLWIARERSYAASLQLYPDIFQSDAKFHCDWISILQDCVVGQSDELEGLRAQFTHQGRLVDHTLSSLTGLSIRTGEPIDEASALKALNEGVNQAFGDRCFGLRHIERVKNMLFSDITGDLFITGELLIATSPFRSERVGATQSFLSDNNQTFLPNNPNPTPARSAKIAKITKQERRTSLYQELFENLEIPVGPVFLALCALGDVAETRRGLKLFNERLILSSEKRAASGHPHSVKGEKVDPTKLFKSIIELHEKKGRLVDLTEVGRHRFATLLQQLCFRAYDGDFSRIVSELRELATSTEVDSLHRSVADQLLTEIVPSLLARLERVEAFKDPESIQFTPFTYQREACLSALHYRKPLIIMGPGTGKTETGVLVAESSKVERVLWCTRSSNRSDTARRVSQASGQEELELDASLRKSNPEKLRALLKHTKYLNAGYDSLWRMEESNPDAFKVLQDWIAPGLKVLDEVHALDNTESKRSKGIQALKSAMCIGLTGTPVQHRLERVASLLHLTMPEEYPDPLSLRAQFKADKSLAQAIFQQHATLLSLDDVALPFAPFHEQPAAAQLTPGVARIPRLAIHRHTFALSAEHTMLYANVSTNYDAWAGARGMKKGALRQLASLRRTLIQPELLEHSPPHALVNAIKEIVMPLLAKNEKCLILGRHLHPLSLLHADPELAALGTQFLSGHDSTKRRAKVMQRFEEDPSLQCVIGQIQCVGTGYNCRGVEHVVLVELPPLVSDTIQGMGRHRRILTTGLERFAREQVHVWCVEPTLDPDVVAQVQNEKQRRVLEKGSVYSAWLDRDLNRIREYQALTGHASKISISEGPIESATVPSIVASIARGHQTLTEKREQFGLLRESHLKEHFYRYRAVEKQAWRTRLRSFVEQHLPKLSSSTQEIQAAFLAGPEALELSVYLDAGIPPQNVLAFEADPDPQVRSFCRQQVNRFGGRFFESRMEQVIPHLSSPLGILSVDSHGYLTPALMKMFIELKLDQRALVLKNTLCQREQGEAGELVELYEGDRKSLDIDLLAVTSSNLHKELSEDRLPELLRVVQRIKVISKACAEELEPYVELSGDNLAAALTSLACSGPLIADVDQFEYLSPKGRPFLSTFAVLERWSDSISKAPSILALARYIRECAVISPSQNQIFAVQRQRGILSLSSSESDGKVVRIRERDIRAMMDNFSVIMGIPLGEALPC